MVRTLSWSRRNQTLLCVSEGQNPTAELLYQLPPAGHCTNTATSPRLDSFPAAVTGHYMVFVSQSTAGMRSRCRQM